MERSYCTPRLKRLRAARSRWSDPATPSLWMSLGAWSNWKSMTQPCRPAARNGNLRPFPNADGKDFTSSTYSRRIWEPISIFSWDAVAHTWLATPTEKSFPVPLGRVLRCWPCTPQLVSGFAFGRELAQNELLYHAVEHALAGVDQEILEDHSGAAIRCRIVGGRQSCRG